MFEVLEQILELEEYDEDSGSELIPESSKALVDCTETTELAFDVSTVESTVL